MCQLLMQPVPLLRCISSCVGPHTEFTQLTPAELTRYARTGEYTGNTAKSCMAIAKCKLMVNSMCDAYSGCNSHTQHMMAVQREGGKQTQDKRQVHNHCNAHRTSRNKATIPTVASKQSRVRLKQTYMH